MKLLFASDSFKGTLRSQEIAQMLTQAAHKVFDDPECIQMPVADGGEGTIDAVVSAVGGTKRKVNVRGPMGEVIEASYAILPDGSAFIEMAQASGITLVPESERNPGLASTYGTGQLIRHAINSGINNIVISIGGSATNDGGLGCLQALGARLYDQNGKLIDGCGNNLLRLAAIDAAEAIALLTGKHITVMCDVVNPLCGTDGATHVYAAQKGATPAQIISLEQGMQNYRGILRSTFGIDPNDLPGSGAAGGLGAALMVVLGAQMATGIDAILQMAHFEDKISDVDMVVTGEGRLDLQSCHGKVVSGIARICRRHGVKAVALVGSKGEGWNEILQLGITKAFAVTDYFPLADSLANPRKTYFESATKMFNELKSLKYIKS